MPSPAVVSELQDLRIQSLVNPQPEGTWQNAYREKRRQSRPKEKRSKKKKKDKVWKSEDAGKTQFFRLW